MLLLAGVIVAFRPASILVETATVKKGPLQEVVSEEGKTRMHDHFVVAATVSGKLRRVDLHPGDAVHAGDIVAWLDPAPIDPRNIAMLEARLEATRAVQQEANSLVGRAEAEHHQATADLERTRALWAEGVTSKESLDKAATLASSAAMQFEAAKSRAQSAAYQVEEARSALLSHGADPSAMPVPIRCPIDGRVLKVLEQSERVVPSGTPIIEIGHSPKMEIVADFLTRDAVQIASGMDALIADWGGDKALRARVRVVEPGGFTKISALGVEEQRANVVLDFVDISDRLADGYRVEVKIIIWQDSNVLKIPASAVFRSGENWAAFTVRNGIARRTQVQLGHRGDFEMELLSGVSAGDQIILHPSTNVEDGTRVKVSEQ